MSTEELLIKDNSVSDDAENALFDDVIDNDDVSNSDSTIYSNWSDSCSTLESDKDNDNTNSNEETNRCLLREHESFSFIKYHRNEEETSALHVTQLKCKTVDLHTIILPLCIRVKVNDEEEMYQSEVKCIWHNVELSCCIESSLLAEYLKSSSLELESKHRLCVELHITRALIKSIMESLSCSEATREQLRKRIQYLSRCDHLTLVCYYILKNNNKQHEEDINGSVDNQVHWSLDALDILAHVNDCTCNDITLIPEYRYHVKLEQVDEEHEKEMMLMCNNRVVIKLNKYWSIQVFNKECNNCNNISKVASDAYRNVNRIVVNSNGTTNATNTPYQNDSENVSTSASPKSNGFSVTCVENLKDHRQSCNVNEPKENSQTRKRTRKSCAASEVSSCNNNNNSRRSNRKASLRAKSCVADLSLQNSKKRRVRCDNNSNNNNNNNNNNNKSKRKQTQEKCKAKAEEIEENSIIIYTTNVRLTFRENKLCAQKGIILNPPYKYASRVLTLVAEPPLIRSVKLLCVLPFVTNIVRLDWLREVLRGDSNDLLHDLALMHKHAYVEKRTILSIECVNEFSIAALLRTPCVNRQSLFHLCYFWVHPTAKPQEPPMNDLKSVIIALGGSLVNLNNSELIEPYSKEKLTQVSFVFVMPSVHVSRSSWRVLLDTLSSLANLEANILLRNKLTSAIYVTPDDVFKSVLQQKHLSKTSVRNVPLDIQRILNYNSAYEQ